MPSDENIRVFLLKKGFNPRSVGEVIRAYRDTIEFVNAEMGEGRRPAPETAQPEAQLQTLHSAPPEIGTPAPPIPSVQDRPQDERVMWFPLAEDCEVRAVFKGHVTQEAIQKFIQFLELSRDTFPKREASKP